MPAARSKPLPPIEALHAHLEYHPDSGAIIRRTGRAQGRRAETLLNHGYQVVRITLGGHRFAVMASWVAWAMTYGEWPQHELDHRDRNKTHNAIGNLRPALGWQNKCNRALPAGRVGVRGVSMDGARFRAQISVAGEKVWLGNFATAQEAKAAYDAAAQRFHGDFRLEARA